MHYFIIYRLWIECWEKPISLPKWTLYIKGLSEMVVKRCRRMGIQTICHPSLHNYTALMSWASSMVRESSTSSRFGNVVINLYSNDPSGEDLTIVKG